MVDTRRYFHHTCIGGDEAEAPIGPHQLSGKMAAGMREQSTHASAGRQLQQPDHASTTTPVPRRPRDKLGTVEPFHGPALLLSCHLVFWVLSSVAGLVGRGKCVAARARVAGEACWNFAIASPCKIARRYASSLEDTLPPFPEAIRRSRGRSTILEQTRAHSWISLIHQRTEPPIVDRYAKETANLS